MEFPDILTEAQKPHIADMDFGAFGPDDIVNTVLQRSEILFDQHRPGRLIRAWSQGDQGPLTDKVSEMGPELLRRAAAVIYLEYSELKPVLQDLAPKRIADIGCGYAFFDLFAARDFGSKLVLIDLEENDSRHFGFQQTGAAYSSLDVAKKFLTDNGVAAGRIETVNPEKRDVSRFKGVDLAVSFLSCGFHYPVSTYRGFFAKVLDDSGALILDVRLSSGSDQVDQLGAMGKVTDISTFDKRRRVLVR